jgi:hypothetical protein
MINSGSVLITCQASMLDGVSYFSADTDTNMYSEPLRQRQPSSLSSMQCSLHVPFDPVVSFLMHMVSFLCPIRCYAEEQTNIHYSVTLVVHHVFKLVALVYYLSLHDLLPQDDSVVLTTSSSSQLWPSLFQGKSHNSTNVVIVPTVIATAARVGVVGAEPQYWNGSPACSLLQANPEDWAIKDVTVVLCAVVAVEVVCSCRKLELELELELNLEDVCVVIVMIIDWLEMDEAVEVVASLE